MRRLHRETPVREKGDVYSTCTFYEQFLPMATQQSPGQKGGEVHKNLSEQRGHLLQCTLQLGGYTAGQTGKIKIKMMEEWRQKEETYSAGQKTGNEEVIKKQTCILKKNRREQGRSRKRLVKEIGVK